MTCLSTLTCKKTIGTSTVQQKQPWAGHFSISKFTQRSLTPADLWLFLSYFHFSSAFFQLFLLRKSLVWSQIRLPGLQKLLNLYLTPEIETIPFTRNFRIEFFHYRRSVKSLIFFPKKLFEKCTLCKQSKLFGWVLWKISFQVIATFDKATDLCTIYSMAFGRGAPVRPN